MPYNGAGVFQRIYSWVQDAANGIFVDATRTDTDTNDIAAGLSNCVTRDGQSPFLADIPAGGYKFTGLADGANSADSVTYGQTFLNPIFTNPSAVASPAPGDNTTKLATTAFVISTAFSSSLPSQSLGFLMSDGTNAAFGQTHTGYAQKEVRGADIASSGVINLTTATGNYVHITGSATITTINIAVGASYTLYIDGTPTFTNSASLELPGRLNIACAAGDIIKVRGDTSGAVVTQYQRAAGTVASYSIKVSQRVANGVNGGASIPNAISQTRILNTTEFNNITGASLAANEVTLPAGTYDFYGSAPASGVGRTKLFLYNVTDATYEGNGYSSNASVIETICTVFGSFTITSPKNFALRHYTQTAQATGLGDAASTGQLEVYAELKFCKVG
jgi:hypothetical protein